METQTGDTGKKYIAIFLKPNSADSVPSTKELIRETESKKINVGVPVVACYNAFLSELDSERKETNVDEEQSLSDEEQSVSEERWDESWDSRDISLIMLQTHKSEAVVRRALTSAKGDVVNAIMELTS